MKLFHLLPPRWPKYALIMGASLLLAVYLPSLDIPFISPAQSWLMGVLSIGFLFSWLAMLLFTLLLIGLRSKWAWLFLALLLAGLPMAFPYWGWQKAGWQEKKKLGTLRVMQWNCMGLEGTYTGASAARQQMRADIVAFIRQQQPDIILIQDFSTFRGNSLRSNYHLLRDTLGYPYIRLAIHGQYQWPWGRQWDGTLICSRIPFVQSGAFPYTGRHYPEFTAWADIVWNNKPLRLVSTHFQSMNLNTEKGQPDPVTYVQYEDSSVIRSGDTWRKLRYYQPYHALQAKTLRSFLDTSKLPVVVGIDMNSMPGSWNYQKVKASLLDAHLEKGSGLGRSFESRVPQLRIDYLLLHPSLKVLQCHTFPVSFSDHYPVLADLQWK